MPRKQKKERSSNLPLTWIIFVLLIVLFLGGWIWWITRTTQHIEKFTVTTSEPEDVELVNRYIDQYLETPMWFGLSKRKHKTLINIEKLQSDILGLFPLFNKATLAIFEGELVVELSSRKATALWCELSDRESCWFIDKERIMFRKAPQFSDGVYIKYSSRLHDTPSMGEQVFDSTMRTYTADVLNLLTESGLEPTRVTQETEDRIEFHINKVFDLKVPQEARIITSTRQDRQVIDERLQILLATPEFITEVTANPEWFEYADLRFPGRLVYKLSDGK